MKSNNRYAFLNLRFSSTEISKIISSSILFILLIFNSNSAAQVNITLDQFRSILTPGQTHYYTNSEETLTKVNIGNKGGPNLYDFTNLSLPSYESSTNYYAGSISNLASRFPVDAITMGNLDLIEKNPVFLFGQDTVFVLGHATNTPPEQYIHYEPYQILAEFPLAYGASFAQTITVNDTTFNSSGGAASIDSYIENNITSVDGYGTLKIDDYEIECLRIKLDHTDMGDKEFIFMTREGYFIDIMISSSEADTGEVNLQKMMVLRTSALTDVKETQTTIPFTFELSQNYPNPFNPSTTINYSLSESAKVILKVFDITGQEIAVILNEEKPAGFYKIEFNAGNFANGIYFYRMQAGSFSETKKLVLLK